MKIEKLIFASHNGGKIAEIRQLLKPLGITVISADEMSLPDIEETGTTFAENSLLKSQTMARLTNLPCIADDSGLCVDALNGAPGIYSARYAPNRDFEQGMDKLLSEMQQSQNTTRKAHFSCVISLAYPDGEYHLFEGRTDGTIAYEKMRGNDGFGYDPLFVPDGETRSFAQMSKEEKSKISHRGRAVLQLLNYLKTL